MNCYKCKECKKRTLHSSPYDIKHHPACRTGAIIAKRISGDFEYGFWGERGEYDLDPSWYWAESISGAGRGCIRTIVI